MSKFDWPKILKQKAGKFCIKSSASQACDICGSRAEEDKTKKKWIKTAQDQEEVDRWIKTQDCKTKKWIGGSRFKKARPKKQSLYRCPGWGRRRSLQVTKVDRWIKIRESKTQESITIPMPRLGTPKVSSNHYGS